MDKLSKNDLLKSQKIIDSMDCNALQKQALTLAEWICNNSMLRKNYSKERKGL